MKDLDLTPDEIGRMGVHDWFSITTKDLQAIGAQLKSDYGPFARVRNANDRNNPPRYIVGSPAENIEKELVLLSAQSKSILAEGGLTGLIRAVAFYHLKFIAIHPLRDANGRSARLIMAQQFLSRGWPGSVQRMSVGMLDNDNFYGMTVASTITDEMRFELMTDILSRIVGYHGPPPSLALPFAVQPESTERVHGFLRFVAAPVSDETRALVEAQAKTLKNPLAPAKA